MIDLGAMEYLIGVWYVRGEGCDWMAAAYREKGQRAFSMRYRFRYYSGSRDPFDKSDRKNWYGGTFDPVMTEAEVIEAVEVVGRTFATAQGTELDCVLVKGRPMDFVKLAADRPWFHFKMEPT